MSTSLPNPTVPTNGQSGDATPILQNFDALLQAIQSFDGSQVQSKSIVETALADAINPRLINYENIFDHVASGCVWSGDSYASNLYGSMTAGVVYVNGYRVVITAITRHLFTASKDTYVDVDYLGNVTYTEVTNNGISPTLAANSVRLAIIVAGASSIAAATSINQGQETMVLPIASSIPYAVTDSLGNLICPRDPNRKTLGYRQILATASGTTVADIVGLSVPVLVPAGRKIKIKSFTDSMQGGTGTAVMTHRIMEGATVLSASDTTLPGNSYYVFLNPEYVSTPTAGLHTYKIQAGASTGTSSFFASAISPAYIRITLE